MNHNRMPPNSNPASPPPAMPLPQGTELGGGKVWAGLQASEGWSATDAKTERMIGDGMRAEHLWKVVVYGDHVVIDLSFGPNARQTLSGLNVPLVAYVPGQVTVTARPVGTGPSYTAKVRCMIVPVDSPGTNQLRRYVEAAAVFAAEAIAYQALTASSVNINGSGPVAVAAGARVLLTPVSNLISGSGFEEYET